MDKIKMIWDFRGPNALKIAEHHEIHLKDYITAHNLYVELTGVEVLSNSHAIAFMVVNEKDVKKLREVLKPHRGLIYEP